jgi:hypothetical protein
MVASISALASSNSPIIARVPATVVSIAPAVAGPTGNVQTAAPTAVKPPVDFGPATVVTLSPQAQNLIAANNNTAAATAQAPNSEVLQTTASQIWAQVLGSLGLTQQQLNALPAGQRTADEAKAEVLAQDLMSQQIAVPAGVSANQVATSIAAAINAVAV